MAFVVIKSQPLNTESQKRLGDRILYALQQEGIKPGETVIRYEAEDSSLYMDGTLVESGLIPQIVSGIGHKLRVGSEGTYPDGEKFTVTAASDKAWKDKERRTQQELFDLKAKLIRLLRRDKSLSSFEAVNKLGLTGYDWAPATLRGMFHELEGANQIRVEGQKRGTRYHWIVKEELPAAKLEKA